jgi:hypothetical protein
MWDLGTLEPEKPVEISEENRPAGSLKDGLENSWKYAGLISSVPGRPRYAQGMYGREVASAVSNLHDIIRDLMFSRRGSKTNQGDYLGYLDQSWRLEYLKEAMLIGIVEDASGQSSAINGSDRIGCRLEPFAPALQGTMIQSTIIRILLPVTPGSD